MTAAQMIVVMAAQMKAEMEANGFKDTSHGVLDVEAIGVERLRIELMYHVVKLLVAEGPVAATEHAADVANCAGMLALALGGLRYPQEGNATSYIELALAKDHRQYLTTKIMELLP